MKLYKRSLFIPSFAVVSFFVLLALLPGCRAIRHGIPVGAIDVNGISPLVTDILDRHDNYVAEDITLGSELGIQLLSRSGQYRGLLQRFSYVWPEQLQQYDDVLIKYDYYVATDDTLNFDYKELLFRSSAIVRMFYKVNEKQSPLMRAEASEGAVR